MKKIKVLFGVLFAFMLCFAFFGCSEKNTDYGTLTVENVILSEGEEKTIVYSFSKPEKAEEITYSFSGSDIEISNGKVKALKGGAVVDVKAETTHHEAYFTVTTTETDYGTLSIADIELVEGKYKTINPVFSVPEFAEDVSYSFDGTDISINNGRVTALVGGKTVTVTARTEHHETTFRVTTLVNYGDVEICDVYAWVGYPQSDIDVTFEFSEYAEELEYSYDDTVIQIDTETNTVKALSMGDVKVTATSEHFKTTFMVHAQTIDKSSDNYNTSNYTSKVAGYKSEWESNGRDGLTTLFIGDSFFDGGFWSNFYSDYSGKDVLRAGVSSTTSCDWEIFTETYLRYTNPKNIVMHMGTNNVYDDGMDVSATVSALQRMFYVIHEQLPDTHIYYFNISQRTYDGAKISIVSSVNKTMADWCANREWITIIDTSSQLAGYMLRDNIHPKNEYYYIFVDALADTDIVIEDSPVKEGVSFTYGVYDKAADTYTLSATSRTRSYLFDGASEYSGNFAVSGTAKISSLNGNVTWTEFIINKTPADDWFSSDSALPVSNITFTNGNSEIWGYKNGGKNSSLAIVNADSFTFTVIAFNNSVLFAFNDTVKVFEDADFTGTYFGFGAENAKIEVSGLNVVINDDAAVHAKYDELAPVPSASIDDIVRSQYSSIGDNAVTMTYQGEALNRNYILQGKLDITDSGNNPHIQFMFNGFDNRILLWDNATDGNWKVGYACNGAYDNAAPTKDIFVKETGETLTLTWKLVVTDSDAYFYINGELRLVWKNISGTSLVLSSENTGVKFYEMSALSLSKDSAEYESEITAMQAIITEFENNAAGIYRT